jgi:hypothetical protein
MTIMPTRHILSILLSLLAAHAAAAPAAPHDELVKAAKAQVGVTIRYDPAYVRLAYPGGDVPPDRGVCTDVIVRAYRKIGIDLQERVHQDMRANWHAYKHVGQWGLKKPDPNIDHRRVPNLTTFLRRQGAALTASRDPADYRPGDIVSWRLPNGLLHIGLVSDRQSPAGVPLVVHNIGAGVQVEDMLFMFTITGHFRYPAATGV